MKNLTLDIGCGPEKLPDAIGIDIRKLPGIKYVHNMNKAPWPVKERFDFMRCQHVIEHIANLEVLVKEIYRLANDGCIVSFITPHYSSCASWGDPTHVHHFGRGSIIQLFEQQLGAGKFETVKNELKFTGALFDLPGWLIYKISPKKYEKYFAWRYPANEIHTTIRILKK